MSGVSALNGFVEYQMVIDEIDLDETDGSAATRPRYTIGRRCLPEATVKAQSRRQREAYLVAIDRSGNRQNVSTLNRVLSQHGNKRNR